MARADGPAGSLWFCRSDNQALDDEAWRRCRDMLSPAERQRAGRFARDVDSDTYVLAHALKRWALSRLLGLAPAELVFLKGSTGRPHLDPSQASGLDFSLSHSGCGALLGVSAAPPIGVDIEQIGRRLADPLAVAGQYFAAEECQALQACPPDRRRALFLSYWTLKEASVKARGEGIAGNLERTRFAVDAAGGVRGTSAATEAHRFALFRPDVDFLAAVALGAGERPDRLEHFLCVPGDPPVRAHWPGGLPS